MTDWLKANKAAVTALCLLVVFIVTAILCQGCALQDLIKVDVPPQVAKAIDSKPQVPLGDAALLVGDWEAYVATNSKKLNVAVGYAQDRYETVASLINLGLESGSQAFPGGAVVSSVLALGAGLFLKRPGEDKRVASEKQSSYNAGIALAKTLLVESKEQTTEKTA